MIHNWYEIWVDESTEIPYILFVCPKETDSQQISVIDPKENNKVIEVMANYEAAREWLCEDEYTLVDGRMKIEYY